MLQSVAEAWCKWTLCSVNSKNSQNLRYSDSINFAILYRWTDRLKHFQTSPCTEFSCLFLCYVQKSKKKFCSLLFPCELTVIKYIYVWFLAQDKKKIVKELTSSLQSLCCISLCRFWNSVKHSWTNISLEKSFGTFSCVSKRSCCLPRNFHIQGLYP